MGPPPPYSPHPGPAIQSGLRGHCANTTQSSEAFLHSVVEVARTETGQKSVEGGRLLNFLRYLLLADYQVPSDVRLNVLDFEQYTKLATVMQDLSDFSKARVLRRMSENTVLGHYLWQSLHEPAKQLGLPCDVVLKMLFRFKTCRNWLGQYKGCTFAVLQKRGLDELALKIHLDRTLLVPALFSDNVDLQHSLWAGIENIRKMYFATLPGIASSPTSRSALGDGGAGQPQITYTLTERGRLYRESYDAVTGAYLADLPAYLPAYRPLLWKVDMCLQEMASRVFGALSGNPDFTASLATGFEAGDQLDHAWVHPQRGLEHIKIDDSTFNPDMCQRFFHQGSDL